MSIGVIIALLVVLAIIGAVAFAVPRMGGRTRPRRRGPVHRERVPAADDQPTTRDERALIREGEAIREQVEARLARRQHRVRPAPIPPVPPTPPVVADEYADPAAYGPADPAAYPAVDGSVPGPTDPAAYRARVRPRRGRLTARDELALQIEQDRLDGYDPAYPGGPPPVDPELLPQTSSSDALERQLQEIAAESRTRPPAVVPPGATRRRRRLGFARPHSAFEEPPEE